jgi:hypothetical protein
LCAGEREKELTRNILIQVESLSNKAKTLDFLGKETMSQSAEIMDLGEESLPVLLQALKDRTKDWKLRYWVTDLLGYVGTGACEDDLLLVIKNPGEKKLIRLRACDSLAGISERGKLDGRKLRIRLKSLLKSVRNKEVARKIQRTIRLVKAGGALKS